MTKYFLFTDGVVGTTHKDTYTQIEIQNSNMGNQEKYIVYNIGFDNCVKL